MHEYAFVCLLNWRMNAHARARAYAYTFAVSGMIQALLKCLRLIRKMDASVQLTCRGMVEIKGKGVVCLTHAIVHTLS